MRAVSKWYWGIWKGTGDVVELLQRADAFCGVLMGHPHRKAHNALLVVYGAC